MEVEIKKETTTVATIRLVDGKLTADNDLGKSLFADTEHVYRIMDKYYDPRKDPQGWLANLYRHLKSPYFWATKPAEQTGQQPELDLGKSLARNMITFKRGVRR